RPDLTSLLKRLIIKSEDWETQAVPSTVERVGVVGFIPRLKPRVFSLRFITGRYYVETNLSSVQKRREIDRLVTHYDFTAKFDGNW
ncbi:hypothetical protein, partial [Halorubrum sp. Boch-26]|uniref:hypothetical protein n=1 Tax=Halorubrum sp. Boch-26 TaxID=2994426 RepID=UPI00246961AC